jgi:Aminotransferase class I and II
MVGDPDLCKRASDLLLDRHGIYIQPINYPTVARGTELLRITPTPAHDVRLIKQLAEAMVAVWQELHLPLGSVNPDRNSGNLRLRGRRLLGHKPLRGSDSEFFEWRLQC